MNIGFFDLRNFATGSFVRDIQSAFSVSRRHEPETIRRPRHGLKQWCCRNIFQEFANASPDSAFVAFFPIIYMDDLLLLPH
jgi:hypothetical protein